MINKNKTTKNVPRKTGSPLAGPCPLPSTNKWWAYRWSRIQFKEDFQALDRGEDVDVIYLDFAKAFDKVPHKRLLRKLSGYGIKGKVYNWIKEFLSNRKQRVVINRTKSEWRKVTSGIPQGSVLGPILFLIFINDMPEVLNCCIKLFADDAKLYSPIKEENDRIRMQVGLKNAEEWAKIWKMFFHIKKCKYLHIISS